MSEEKLDFNRPFLVLGNLALVAWMFLAFFSVWFYNQVYGYIFLLFTAAAIFLILRRLGCSSCYYCKSCTSGFGRLAGAFFGTGSIKQGSVGNRLGFIMFIYFLLFPLPVALLSVSMVEPFLWLKVLVMVCLLGLSVYSAATWVRKKRQRQSLASTKIL